MRQLPCRGADRRQPHELGPAFAEGLVTAHPSMPAFELEANQIADLIAYLESVSGTGPGD